MDIADMDFMQKLCFKNFEFSAKSDRLLGSGIEGAETASAASGKNPAQISMR
jgi:hypothetical protein